MPEVRVTFRKAVSDGNYGTEMAECTLALDADPGEDEVSLARTLLGQARERVHAELGVSPVGVVRRAVEVVAQRRSVPSEPVDDGDELPFAEEVR